MRLFANLKKNRLISIIVIVLLVSLSFFIGQWLKDKEIDRLKSNLQSATRSASNDNNNCEARINVWKNALNDANTNIQDVGEKLEELYNAYISYLDSVIATGSRQGCSTILLPTVESVVDYGIPWTIDSPEWY